MTNRPRYPALRQTPRRRLGPMPSLAAAFSLACASALSPAAHLVSINAQRDLARAYMEQGNYAFNGSLDYRDYIQIA